MTANGKNNKEFAFIRKLFPGPLRVVAVIFGISFLSAAALLFSLCYRTLGKINYTTLPVSDSLSVSPSEADPEILAEDEFGDPDSLAYIPEELIGVGQTDKDIENIIFFGLDTYREGVNTGRSDVIMILSVDYSSKKFRAASILRDCYVKIPGHRKNRLNAAYALGGPALAINTVNQNFSTDIQKYVKIDFFGTAKIIDLLGGICLDELSEKEADQIRRYMVGGESNVQAGKNVLLSGKEAVAYAQIRHIDSDFSRTARQRKVLKQLILKLFDLRLREAPAVLDKIMPNLETNLTKKEILSLGFNVLVSGFEKNVEELCIPIDGGYQYATINGASVILPDLPANTEALRDFLYPDKSGD